jgi:hypothetical protein
MATNAPTGDGRRYGAVRNRSQTHNPVNDRWTKRDSETGKFIDQKADDLAVQGREEGEVRHEHGYTRLFSKL